MSLNAASLPQVQIFADGACKCTPGLGSWGFLMKTVDGADIEAFGGERGTTAAYAIRLRRHRYTVQSTVAPPVFHIACRRLGEEE